MEGEVWLLWDERGGGEGERGGVGEGNMWERASGWGRVGKGRGGGGMGWEGLRMGEGGFEKGVDKRGMGEVGRRRCGL